MAPFIPNRRDLLGTAAMTVAVLAVEAASERSFILSALDLVIKNETDQKSMQTINRLKARYGCRIEFAGDETEQDSYEPALHNIPLPIKKHILQDLSNALSKYPPEMIREMNLTLRVTTLIKRPYDYFIDLGSAATASMDIGLDHCGKPVISSVINLSAAFGEIPPHATQGLLHHEIGHLVDKLAGFRDGWQSEDIDQTDASCTDLMTYRLDGGFVETNKTAMDSDWAALKKDGMEDYINEEGSNLAQLARVIKNAIQKLITGRTKPQGYVSSYATSSVDEDKAETMKSMVSGQSKSEKDQVVLEKIKKAKQHYWLASNGKMNEKYWADLAAGKVDETYWK